MLCINLRPGTASLAGCMPEVLPRAVAPLFAVEWVRGGVVELVGSVVNELVGEGTLRVRPACIPCVIQGPASQFSREAMAGPLARSRRRLGNACRTQWSTRIRRRWREW